MNDDVILNDASPSLDLDRRWGYDDNLYSIEQDEDLVLHDEQYVPILLELAADESCGKSQYAIGILSYFTQLAFLHRPDGVIASIAEHIRFAIHNASIVTSFMPPLARPSYLHRLAASLAFWFRARLRIRTIRPTLLRGASLTQTLEFLPVGPQHPTASPILERSRFHPTVSHPVMECRRRYLQFVRQVGKKPLVWIELNVLGGSRMDRPWRIPRDKLPNHRCVVAATSFRRSKIFLVEYLCDLVVRLSPRAQFTTACH